MDLKNLVDLQILGDLQILMDLQNMVELQNSIDLPATQAGFWTPENKLSLSSVLLKIPEMDVKRSSDQSCWTQKHKFNSDTNQRKKRQKRRQEKMVG